VPSRPTAPFAVATLLGAVLVLGLAGGMTFQALIPLFAVEWSLSAAEAGWIAGCSYLAYAAVAPLAVGVTDRIDARLILLGGCAVSALAGLGFALLAQGFWTALLFRGLAGIGVAATYMPGLKALTDRITGPARGRCQALYTAVYSVGTALSLMLGGVVGNLAGWPAAFLASALLPAAAGLLVLAGLTAVRPAGAGHERSAWDLRPLLAQRRALRFVLAYGGHCWELFGFRTWIVAFLTFTAAATGTALSPAAIALIATLLLLAGLPASILGNELAARHGRPRVTGWLMAASALVALLLGLAAALPWWLVLALAGCYGLLVMADSAALTVGTIGAARAELQGATIALQTFAGAIGALLGPLAAGYALDLAGADGPAGWALAFAVIGAGALLGPALLFTMPAAAPARAQGERS
jgi:MFS family permease